jgi:prevent-host-death family protein
MTALGIFEARDDLSTVLDSVEHGERVTITSHGEAIAEVVPMVDRSLENREQAIESFRRLRECHRERLQGFSLDDLIDEMRALRSRLPTGGPSIRELIDEGRRF